MIQGKLKWFDPKKGYGFIKPDDGDKDAFLHVSALEKANITQLMKDKLLNTNSLNTVVRCQQQTLK